MSMTKSKLTGYVAHIVQLTICSMLDGHLLLGKIHVVNYLVHLGSFCCSGASGPMHAQLKSFLPSLLSCRHRALSRFSVLQAIEAGQIPGTRLGLWLPCNLGTRPSKILGFAHTRSTFTRLTPTWSTLTISTCHEINHYEITLMKSTLTKSIHRTYEESITNSTISTSQLVQT